MATGLYGNIHNFYDDINLPYLVMFCVYYLNTNYIYLVISDLKGSEMNRFAIVLSAFTGCCLLASAPARASSSEMHGTRPSDVHFSSRPVESKLAGSKDETHERARHSQAFHHEFEKFEHAHRDDEHEHHHISPG